MDNNNTGRALNWDDEISKESDFQVLPEGDYDFEVVNFERDRHPGSEKLPACPKAVITLRVDSADGKADIKYNLFLHSQTEGMISAFFIGIGLKKHGEPFHMDWNKVIGCKGRCKIAIRKYNGNDYNDVKKIYEPANMSSQQQSFNGGF